MFALAKFDETQAVYEAKYIFFGFCPCQISPVSTST